MMIIPYKAEHLMDLQIQPDQLTTLPPITPEYALFLEGPYTFTAIQDGRILLIAGITQVWEHRALAWALVDPGAKRYFAHITAAAKKLLDAVPFRRIEADTPCEWVPGHRWLRCLGFRMEAPRMQGYRLDGGDSALYARVR